MDGDRVRTRTNRSGVQGGISNGETIYFRVAFKPTATIMSLRSGPSTSAARTPCSRRVAGTTPASSPRRADGRGDGRPRPRRPRAPAGIGQGRGASLAGLTGRHGVRAILAPLRGLGRERLVFLSLVTGGHAIIHWFQQMFAVVLPSVTQGLALTEVQVGYLQSARQLTSGTMNLPVGLLSDSFARWRAVILASALLFMGVGYFCMGAAGGLGGALVGAALVGLGTAAWHPPAMGALSLRFPERRATALSIHGMGATLFDTLTPLRSAPCC